MSPRYPIDTLLRIAVLFVIVYTPPHHLGGNEPALTSAIHLAQGEEPKGERPPTEEISPKPITPQEESAPAVEGVPQEEVSPTEEEEGYVVQQLLEEEEAPWEGPRFELKGFYRLLGNWIAEPDLNSQSPPGALYFWQHRLRLNPAVWLDPKTVMRMDLLVGEGERGCTDPSLLPYYAPPCDGIFGANGFNVLETNLADRNPNLRLVRFWAEITTPVGALRVGRQPSHWGLGLFSNDGLRPGDFGVPHFGDTYDRVAFATKPLGKDSPLIMALVWDLISHGSPVPNMPGPPTLLKRSDDVNEGILVLLYKTDPLDFGVYQVIRQQKTPRNYIFASDVYGRLDIGILYGAFENVWLYGSTRALPILDLNKLELLEGEKVRVSAYMWAMELGLRYETDLAWIGKYDFKIKAGMAPGDQNSLLDKKITSFSFKPDYQVGILMFRSAYANLIERKIAAQVRQLNLLISQGRLASDTLDKLAVAFSLARTNGSVANAIYLYPVLKLEPRENLRFKMGLLWAQTQSGVAVRGSGANATYSKELGFEENLGIEYTLFQHFTLGIEAAALQPGKVFSRPQTTVDPLTGAIVELNEPLISPNPMYFVGTKFIFHLD